MSRRHADVVEVRRRDDVPEQFLWRNRLYQIREVLGHWVESGAWWRSAPSSALIDGADADTAAGHPPSGLRVGPMTLDDGEREFWRVEAGAGRVAPPGIYDLCFDWSANRWQLVRVMD
jgi:hypothetical protein